MKGLLIVFAARAAFGLGAAAIGGAATSAQVGASRSVRPGRVLP